MMLRTRLAYLTSCLLLGCSGSPPAPRPAASTPAPAPPVPPPTESASAAPPSAPDEPPSPPLPPLALFAEASGRDGSNVHRIDEGLLFFLDDDASGLLPSTPLVILADRAEVLAPRFFAGVTPKVKGSVIATRVVGSYPEGLVTIFLDSQGTAGHNDVVRRDAKTKKWVHLDHLVWWPPDDPNAERRDAFTSNNWGDTLPNPTFEPDPTCPQLLRVFKSTDGAGGEIVSAAMRCADPQGNARVEGCNRAELVVARRKKKGDACTVEALPDFGAVTPPANLSWARVWIAAPSGRTELLVSNVGGQTSALVNDGAGWKVVAGPSIRAESVAFRASGGAVVVGQGRALHTARLGRAWSDVTFPAHKRETGEDDPWSARSVYEVGPHLYVDAIAKGVTALLSTADVKSVYRVAPAKGGKGAGKK